MENWADTKSPGGLRWRADTTPPHCQVMGTCWWWTTAWLEMIYQLTGFIFCFLETIRARCGDTGRQVMTKVRSAWQTPATPSPLQFNNIFLNCLTISAQCLMVADPCWAPCSTSQLGLDSGGRGEGGDGPSYGWCTQNWSWQDRSQPWEQTPVWGSQMLHLAFTFPIICNNIIEM